MLVFLYGRDRFRLLARRDQFIHTAVNNQPAAEVSVFDLAESSDLDKLRDLIQSQSLLQSPRLMCITNAFAGGERLYQLIGQYSLHASPTDTFLLIEHATKTELTKKDKLLMSLFTTAPAQAEYFESLTGKDIEQWVLTSCRERGVTVTPKAVQKLLTATVIPSEKFVKFAISDSGRIRQELDKLMSYLKTTTSTTIDDALVDQLVTPSINLKVFDLIDAVGTRNKAQAIKLLASNLEQRMDPHYILSMLAYQFRNLLTVKSLLDQRLQPDQIASQTKLHPYVVQKSQAQSARFSLAELKQFYQRLGQLDQDFKNGEIDIVDGLYGLLFGLS